MLDPHRFQLKHVSCTSKIDFVNQLTHRDSISRVANHPYDGDYHRVPHAAHVMRSQS
jgi:hypothetical protein